jgi:CRISPR-associated protein Csx10
MIYGMGRCSLMIYKVELELMSDLCAANGEGSGNSVDSDICTDRYGLPYIPARRIKGCMRESANELLNMGYTDIDKDKIDRLFGDAYGQSGLFSISDFTLENAASVRAAIDDINSDLKNANSDILEQYVSNRKIEDMFTTVRGRTMMKDGVKVDNSLRFVRVLNQYNPFKQERERLKLVGTINLNTDDYKDLLSTICKATRHIGLNRNRGLGNVRLTLEEINNKKDSGSKEDEDEKQYVNEKQYADEKRYVITYKVINEAPLTLPEYGNDYTCIPARSVIGCLANAYLKNSNANADTQAFKDLFLNGKTVWSSLNPVIDGELSSPVPLMLMKVKNDGGRLINRPTLTEKEWIEVKKNKPKTMEGSYAALRKEDGKTVYRLSQPVAHTVYHNSIKNEKDQGLYMQTSIDEGYVFGGTVEVSGSYVETVKKLLTDTDFRFGRSKNAQYAACRLVEKPVSTEKTSEQIDVKEGEKLFVILKSDLVLDANGMYDVSQPMVRKMIAEAVAGVKLKEIKVDEAKDNSDSSLYADHCLYGIMGGYNNMWNLQKPHVPYVKAGSYYCFEVETKTETETNTNIPKQLVIGEYTHEGFGVCEVVTEAEMSERSKVEKGSTDRAVNEEIDAAVRKNAKDIIKANAILECLRETAREKAVKERKNKDIPISRLRLMLDEAVDFDDFMTRVESMKTSDEHSQKVKGKKKISEELIWSVYAISGEFGDYVNVKTGEIEKRGEIFKNIRWNDMLGGHSNDKILGNSLKEQDIKVVVERAWKLSMEVTLHTLYYAKER